MMLRESRIFVPSKLSVPSLSISHLGLCARKTSRRGFVRRTLTNTRMGTCLSQAERSQVHPRSNRQSGVWGASSARGGRRHLGPSAMSSWSRVLSSISVVPKVIVHLLSRDLPCTLHAELSGESHGTSRIGSHHTRKPFRSQSDRHLVHPSRYREGFALSFFGKRGGSRSH